MEMTAFPVVFNFPHTMWATFNLKSEILNPEIHTSPRLNASITRPAVL
jgi:hypothetical protein